MSKTCAHWSSIANLNVQLAASLDYFEPFADDSWQNPFTTPVLLLKYPNLIPKLVKKQMNAREDHFIHIRQEMNSIEPVLKSMMTLIKDAIAKEKSNPFIPTKYFNPVEITYQEAAYWITTLLQGCHDEFNHQKKILEEVDSRVHEGNIEHSKLQWQRQIYVDSTLEKDMRNRFKLFNQMNDKFK